MIGGWGTYFKSTSKYNKSSRNTQYQTIDEGELKAILFAISQAPAQYNLRVFSDSQYAIDVLNKCSKWKKRQWNTCKNRYIQ